MMGMLIWLQYLCRSMYLNLLMHRKKILRQLMRH
nr:MAG TPA: hypothetical protein [Bacteriophage sp.]